MSDRVVNLSETPRAAVTLQLGGTSFRIAFVVNAVAMIYSSVLKEASVLMDKAEKVAAKEDELRAATEEKQPAILEQIAGVTAEIEHFSREKLDKLMRCIELVLVNNGYEFNRTWWEEHGDVMAYQTFIVEALMKDSPQKKTAEGAG